VSRHYNARQGAFAHPAQSFVDGIAQGGRVAGETRREAHHAVVHAAAAAGTDRDRGGETAVVEVLDQIGTIVLQAVAPELAKYRTRLDGGSVDYAFRLDHEGRLQSVKVVSSTSNKLVEDTCLKMIRVAKFPPIPKEA